MECHHVIRNYFIFIAAYSRMGFHGRVLKFFVSKNVEFCLVLPSSAYWGLIFFYGCLGYHVEVIVKMLVSRKKDYIYPGLLEFPLDAFIFLASKKNRYDLEILFFCIRLSGSIQAHGRWSFPILLHLYPRRQTEAFLPALDSGESGRCASRHF